MNVQFPLVDVLTPMVLFTIQTIQPVFALAIIISLVLIVASVFLNVTQIELWKLVTVHATVLNTLKTMKLARLVSLPRMIAFTQLIPSLLI